jgi:hypothetical protein
MSMKLLIQTWTPAFAGVTNLFSAASYEMCVFTGNGNTVTGHILLNNI